MKAMALPPTPSTSPRLQTLRWLFRPIAFMESCRREFGETFGLMFIGFETPLYFSSDPGAIRAVYSGRSGIPGEVAISLVEHLADDNLSPRETDVLRAIARGYRNKQVAASFGISEETIKMHVKNIFVKLGAADRTHAVTIAIQRGIISL